MLKIRIINKNREIIVSWIFFMVFLIFFNWISVNAQNQKILLPSDEFVIPESNGSIRFSLSGNYESAKLENGIWNFTNLYLNKTSYKIEKFKVSASNSDIIILSIESFGEDDDGLIFSYSATGVGEQTFKFSNMAYGGDWSIAFDDVFIPENSGWEILPDNTLSITEATFNVTALYFVLSDNTSNQTYFEQHSISIIIITFTAIVIALATIIKYINLKNLKLFHSSK